MIHGIFSQEQHSFFEILDKYKIMLVLFGNLCRKLKRKISSFRTEPTHCKRIQNRSPNDISENTTELPFVISCVYH